MCSYLISMRLGHLYVLARELSYELTKPHGALSLLILCKCWNRRHCIAPSLLCYFAHNCSSCFGPHHVGACPVEPPSQSCPSCKRPVDASPPRSSGSCGSTPNGRRLNLCWMAFIMGLNWVLVLLKSSSLPRGTSLVLLGMPLSLYLANEVSLGRVLGPFDSPTGAGGGVLVSMMGLTQMSLPFITLLLIKLFA